MTTTMPSPVPRADSPADAGEEHDPAGERGRTTIADRAVERIAAAAITEVDGVGGAARRMLGVAVGGEDLDRAARATARVSGHTASLDVRLSVTYPRSVARTTEAARAHLMSRVRELTGLDVSRVDITVTALHSELADTTRRIQ